MSNLVPSPPLDATTTRRGLMSAADKVKLDAQSGTNTGDVTVSSPAGWLSRVGQALTFALVSASASVAGVVDLAAQTFAGAKTFTSAIIASAGIQLASLWNTNGTGASDVGVKLGVSTADGSVNSSARLAQITTGIGGTETARYWWTKDLTHLGGGAGWALNNNFGGHLGFQTGATTVLALLSGGVLRSGYGFDINPTFGANITLQLASSGLMNQRGTDSTGTPGAAIIDRPVGKSAIAAGASSVVVTNNLVTASSHIDITPHENAADNAEFRNFKVKPAAGSFTVTVSSSVANAWPFTFRVSTRLT